MTLPRVTILIANYNDEEYLEKAIESAVNQDYPGSLQICIVDDGSTDGSWDVITPYVNNPAKDIHSRFDVTFSRTSAGKFGNTKVVAIKNENSGPSQARNVGIEYTLNDTDIYAILDSDDEMYENKVSECVKVFESGGEAIGVVYGDYDTFHVSTKKIIREYKEPYHRRRLVQECIVHSGSLISAKALKSVLEAETGYYDKTMRTCEDYDLWMRISEKFIIAHVPKSLTLVRVTGDNSSFIVNQEVWQKNWIKVMEKMQQRINAK